MSTLPTTREERIVEDAYDYKGCPADRTRTGGWSAAAMMIGSELVERLTTLGIAVNLVTYLTATMHLDNGTSANVVTNFMGASFMLCLFGGFLADTFLGRYLTIAIFAAVQAMGATLLTISTIIPSLHPPKCTENSTTVCVKANTKQLLVLYLALYVIALGTGGIKSSVSGFGSDQFDESNKEEKKDMIKFFSWFYFIISIGSLSAVTILVYIQDNQGRDWGYGFCAVGIVVALFVFLLGTRKYRIKPLVGSPLTQIAAVFVCAWRKRHFQLPFDSSLLYEEDDFPHEQQHRNKKQRLPHSKQFRFLDKAAIKDLESTNGMTKKGKWYNSTLTDVEEVKLILRMLPIWATNIMFWTDHAQMITFSVSQATTMDSHIGKSFQIPSASMTIFIFGTVLIIIPFYNQFIRPIAKKVLKNSYGLTPLQQIGLALVLATLSMVAAALVEIKRLRFAKSHGFLNDPTAKMPLSIFWLVPQFLLVGLGEAFMYVGQLDFFLIECPKGMKSMSTGLFLSTLSLGFFFSSILVNIVQNLTGSNKPWIATSNLNQGRLYDFYWLLAIISTINLVIYLVCAKLYVYKENRLLQISHGIGRVNSNT